MLFERLVCGIKEKKMGKDFKSMVIRCIYVLKENDNVKKLKIIIEEFRDLYNSVMKWVKMYED